MKKKILIVFTILIALGLAACSNKIETNVETIDIDITKMNSTVAYAQTYDFYEHPNDYLGKNIKISGVSTSSKIDGKTYYACEVEDEDGHTLEIEYELINNEYPSDGQNITIYGTFFVYVEHEELYCQIKNAIIQKQKNNL